MPYKKRPEELVSYERGAHERYSAVIERLRKQRSRDTRSRVSSPYPPWPHRVGRGKHGEFPLVVVADYYRRQGYTVWFCEPALESCGDPDFKCFMLLSYPGRRNAGHPAYRRMQDVFGEMTIARLVLAADKAKRRMNRGQGNRGGGDPDLFVFRGGERFFVEVKWKDHITEKQRVTFPLIEKYLSTEVRIARITERRVV